MDILAIHLKVLANETARDHPEAMVTVVNDDEKIIYASPSATKLFGYAQSDLVGHHISDFLGRLDMAHIRLMIQDALLNGLSVATSRQVWLKFGGTRCMHGPGRGFFDPKSGRAYVIAVARPCEEVQILG